MDEKLNLKLRTMKGKLARRHTRLVMLARKQNRVA